MRALDGFALVLMRRGAARRKTRPHFGADARRGAHLELAAGKAGAFLHSRQPGAVALRPRRARRGEIEAGAVVRDDQGHRAVFDAG